MYIPVAGGELRNAAAMSMEMAADAAMVPTPIAVTLFVRHPGPEHRQHESARERECRDQPEQFEHLNLSSC